MILIDNNFLKTFSEKTSQTPIWFMRQAGRYLPEYLEIRNKTNSFLEFCYNPELSSIVTLQPIKRFDFDAAIFFSDILVIPDALGKKVWFEKNYGPKLDIWNLDNLPEFNEVSFLKHLQPVYEGIKIAREKLNKEKALIGFAGAPWTIATYCLEGGGSKTFEISKKLAYNYPNKFLKLIDLLTEAITIHLINQIKAGANALQIFDSWAGILDDFHFEKYSINPVNNIINNIKKIYPNIPIIFFPKNAYFNYKKIALEMNIDGLSLDSNIDIKWIIENLDNKITLQGNLDPMYLLTENTDILKRKLDEIMINFKNRKHIFNLGHGINKDTPIKNVEFVVDYIRNFK